MTQAGRERAPMILAGRVPITTGARFKLGHIVEARLLLIVAASALETLATVAPGQLTAVYIVLVIATALAMSFTEWANVRHIKKFMVLVPSTLQTPGLKCAALYKSKRPAAVKNPPAGAPTRSYRPANYGPPQSCTRAYQA